ACRNFSAASATQSPIVFSPIRGRRFAAPHVSRRSTCVVGRENWRAFRKKFLAAAPSEGLGRCSNMDPSVKITELLQRLDMRDPQALDAVIPLVYGELKKLAAGHLRLEGKGRPLDTTELVHEAFLRLSQGQLPSIETRSHFYGIASRLMRQVLVDL